MKPEEIEKLKTKKMEFLQETIYRCMKEPAGLTLKEIAFVLCWEFEDITEFLKEYKKEQKKYE